MSSRFTCRFCKEQFDVPKGLYKHLQLVHNAGASRENQTCPICGVLCSKSEGYKDHLLYIHGQANDSHKLTFKSLNEFLIWKTELELKYRCKYVLQTSPKLLPTKEKKYFYQCDRSNSRTRDKKASMSVVMKTCSSVICVIEGTGVFKVEYWDTHSGHDDVPSVSSAKSDLEAAISSIAMVNAIDSDESFDRTEEMLISGNSGPSVSNIQKTYFMKNSNVNNLNNSSISTSQKSKGMPLSGTTNKTNNKSVLLSLASVACGKGIKKKPVNKLNEKSAELKTNSENVNENLNNTSSSVKRKSDTTSKGTLSTDKSRESTAVTATSISSSTVTTKIAPSGPPVIAPKLPTIASNSINSLFASNQFVIMNPVSMDQNSINSSPNVFTTGQNILLSLNTLGQNVASNTIPQATNMVSVSEEIKTKSDSNTKVAKAVTSPKVNTSIASKLAKKPLTVTPSVSSSIINTAMTPSMTTTSPITLTSGLSNAPVILSSLPVGSTFMSVNNNLIPIASPSGAFLPTSLPPNIVLTPLVPGTSASSADSFKTTLSSVNVESPVPPKAPTHLSATSTVSVTVSSIVKEPVYTSSIKQKSSIITSNAPSLPSTPTVKNSRQRTSNKFVPITTATTISSDKKASKSTSPKGSSNINKSKNVPNSVENNLTLTDKLSLKTCSPVSNKSFIINIPSLTPPNSKAKKGLGREVRPILNASPVTTANDLSSSFNTKVVNSRLNMTPISSTSSTSTTPQMHIEKPGTMYFESSTGDIYMLEPVENCESPSPGKHISPDEFPKIKIERSVQTAESLTSLKSKFQRKRAAPPTDDSAVMLKVKCYRLEMKYLKSEAECKRLKVELTKERLKNNGNMEKKESPTNIEKVSFIESPNNNTSAVEIMKDIEEKFSESKDSNIYTMTKTSVLRSLYEDMEELCIENNQLHKELEHYRAHDKFYKNLKKKLYDEEF